MKNFYIILCISIIANANRAFSSEAGMPQLNPEFWAAQIFWLILVFTILYLIVWKIFIPRISFSIENRKSRIVNDLNEANKLKEKAEEKLKEYNKIIENSKIEAKKIVDDNKKRLDKDLEEKKHKFNTEIEKEILNAEKEIKSLRKSSVSDINKIASENSIDIIKQIINTEVNKSSVSAIVNEAVKRNLEKSL